MNFSQFGDCAKTDDACCPNCFHIEGRFSSLAVQSDYVHSEMDKTGAGSVEIADVTRTTGTVRVLKISGTHTGLVSKESYQQIGFRSQHGAPLGYYTAGQVTKIRFVFAWQDADNYAALEEEWNGDDKRAYYRLMRREAGVETVIKHRWWTHYSSASTVDNPQDDDKRWCHIEQPAPGAFSWGGFLFPGTTWQVFYDAESGWFQFMAEGGDTPRWFIGGFTGMHGQHRFDPPLPAGKVGVVTGDRADNSADLSNYYAYPYHHSCVGVSNTSVTFDATPTPGFWRRCPKFLAYWLCDQSQSQWPEEVNLSITGFKPLLDKNFEPDTGHSQYCADAESINGNYVMQRMDESDYDEFPYRNAMAFMNASDSPNPNDYHSLGGVVWRYTFEEPICWLHHMDLWIGGSQTTTGYLELQWLDEDKWPHGSWLLRRVRLRDGATCRDCPPEFNPPNAGRDRESYCRDCAKTKWSLQKPFPIGAAFPRNITDIDPGPPYIFTYAHFVLEGFSRAWSRSFDSPAHLPDNHWYGDITAEFGDV